VAEAVAKSRAHRTGRRSEAIYGPIVGRQGPQRRSPRNRSRGCCCWCRCRSTGSDFTHPQTVRADAEHLVAPAGRFVDGNGQRGIGQALLAAVRGQVGIDRGGLGGYPRARTGQPPGQAERLTAEVAGLPPFRSLARAAAHRKPGRRHDPAVRSGWPREGGQAR
jgi:hypothetical protein